MGKLTIDKPADVHLRDRCALYHRAEDNPYCGEVPSMSMWTLSVDFLQGLGALVRGL